MVWDLGHIGNFEELWLLHNAWGDGWLHAGYERMFDAVLNPRPTREGLPLPQRGELFDYLAAVRERALGRLFGNGAGGSESTAAADAALLDGGFVYELVAEHDLYLPAHRFEFVQLFGSCSFEISIIRAGHAPDVLVDDHVGLCPLDDRSERDLRVARCSNLAHQYEIERCAQSARHFHRHGPAQGATP